MSDDNYPWPEGDEKFLVESDNGCYAWLSGQTGDWYPYIEGYFRAAQLLVEHALQSPHDSGYLIYPIMFLYRQHLELRLKKLILDGNRLLDTRIIEIKKTHRIDDLWKTCRSIVDEIWHEDSSVELNVADSCLDEIAKIDPMSMAFRYPVNLEHYPLLPQNLKRIDLNNVEMVMEKLANLLRAISDAISERLDAKWEIERWLW